MTQVNQTLSANHKGNRKYHDFSDQSLAEIISLINSVLAQYPSDLYRICSNEDTPVYFDIDSLAEYLEIVANQQGGNSNQFISTMVMRIRAMLGDTD